MEVAMSAAQQKPGRTDDSESGSTGSDGKHGFAETASDAVGEIESAASSIADTGFEAVSGVGETVRRAGRSEKARASTMAEQAQNAGGETVRAIETEMSERPWSVALAAAVAAGVLGYLLGSRR
jgi:ElaB/YqjD/DUF883 family membrane-anchored ribosome-binding protein